MPKYTISHLHAWLIFEYAYLFVFDFLGFSQFQGSNSRKLYFIYFERGPRAFIDGTAQLLHECFSKAPSMQHICQYASSYISERVAVLTILRRSLATFLAEVGSSFDCSISCIYCLSYCFAYVSFLVSQQTILFVLNFK